MHLPSAGMIRFRFDGFAFASQPFEGHPEVGANIRNAAQDARGGYQIERVPRVPFVSPLCVKDANGFGAASGGSIWDMGKSYSRRR
jgi:hypothetical protein